MQGWIVIALVAFAAEVSGRGRLLVPPQRSSLWREDPFRFNTNINYQDHTLDCGGIWKRNLFDGKCGVCGDAWDAEKPRPNEAGGIYAQGVLGRTYYSDKQFIEVEVEVLSSIQGFFEFRICPNNDVTETVTQDCLDENQLIIRSRDRVALYGQQFYPSIKPGQRGIVELSLEMPEGLVCSQCVLQWKWHGGNNWGRCYNGLYGKGCGKQTEYYNCADIAIIDRPTPKTSSTTEAATRSEQTTTTEATMTTTEATTTTTEATTPEPTTTMDTTTTSEAATTTTEAATTTTEAATTTTEAATTTTEAAATTTEAATTTTEAATTTTEAATTTTPEPTSTTEVIAPSSTSEPVPETSPALTGTDNASTAPIVEGTSIADTSSATTATVTGDPNLIDLDFKIPTGEGRAL